jgi:cell division protein FtsW
MKNLFKNTFKNTDVTLTIIVGALLLFGLVTLSSASSPIAYQKFGDNYYYVKHQMLYGLLPGLVLFFICLVTGYHFWKKKAMLIFGFSFQPAELVKITFIFYLAAWLESRGMMKLRDFQSGLLPFLISLGAIMLLMIFQPDIGTMSIIVATALVVYFVAGAPIFQMCALGCAGFGFFILLIKAAPYRAARFMTFLHPELDPQGIGYHINQALLAIGSGGLFGLGLGHSRQKFQYLPEVAGDSIFAVFAEEFGFIFSCVFVFIFLVLLAKGLKIAIGARDNFGKLLAVGITVGIVIQAFINIGSMVGLLPMTGVPLPFVSAGGSSLAMSLAGIGILLNIAKKSKEK